VSIETGATKCARHPNVETGLACGRCETPICPKCMVMTDVGARCPTCAPRRKLPQFEIGALYLLRGLAAALAAGAALGAFWGLLLQGFLGLITIFLGIGLGYGVAEPVSLATNRKAGTPLQAVAALGVVLAYVTRNLVAGDPIVPTDDLFGYVALIVGVVIAVNRLRY
jgi:hypothetical protein